MAPTNRWRAVAKYRKTHDVYISHTRLFEELAEIAAWIETGTGLDWRALDTLTVTYVLSDEKLTLTQIAVENGEHLSVDPAEEPTFDN